MPTSEHVGARTFLRISAEEDGLKKIEVGKDQSVNISFSKTVNSQDKLRRASADRESL